MADIKTTLRELSVATTLGTFIKNREIDLDTLLNPQNFINQTKSVVSGEIKFSDELLCIQSFDKDLIQIIKNGYILGKKIYENPNFTFSSIDKILWLGEDTQKMTPEDIIVGDYHFSLKETSNILDNMGLYNLLNYLTGSNYKKGSKHIFNDFAPKEYSSWFEVTWSLLLSYLKENNLWIHNNKKSKIKLLENSILLTYDNKVSKLPLNCTLAEYTKNTTGVIREKVFSKFISTELSSNSKYKLSKRNCAIIAAKNLSKELTNNLNYTDGLARFLRMYYNPYYYAKVSNEICEIYRVPCSKDLGDKIIIDSITYNVPKDQVNILTIIKNKETNESLTLRTECRFSHGQFNGTPEAKLYYENKGNLLSIYEKL